MSADGGKPAVEVSSNESQSGHQILMIEAQEGHEIELVVEESEACRWQESQR